MSTEMVKRKRGRPPKGVVVVRPEITENIKYINALRSFMHRLEDEQNAMLVGASFSYAAYHESLRYWDKVLLIVNRGITRGTATVRLFVDKNTGTIYGLKSNDAPNLKHYYGTIYTADLWDWSGTLPVPKDAEAAGVRPTKKYSGFVHWEPIPKGRKSTRDED